VVHDPPILILDEPTSGLDVLAASTTLEFVARCRDEGKCVLFSTHVMSEAEKLCDRIAIIHRGTIRAEGTLDELRAATGQHYLEDVFRHVVQETPA
jgi:sodium transport system ATP-binding protein